MQSAFCHFWKEEVEWIDSPQIDVCGDVMQRFDAVQEKLKQKKFFETNLLI